MKKIILIIILTLYTFINISALTASKQPINFDTVGAGSETNPYIINELSNLRWLSEVNLCSDNEIYLVQTADIDASETKFWNKNKGFKPISLKVNKKKYVSRSFLGIRISTSVNIADYTPNIFYEGNNHSISNLTINRNKYIGLFGEINAIKVMNLNLEQINYRGNKYIGGISGFAEVSQFINCKVTGVIIGKKRVGGLIGYGSFNSFSKCNFLGCLTAEKYIGGITAFGKIIDIDNCRTNGMIKSTTNGGGLIGFTESSIIMNSSVNMNISGIKNIGGFVGYGNMTNINKCKIIGNISGKTNVNYVVGYGKMYLANDCLINSKITTIEES